MIFHIPCCWYEPDAFVCSHVEGEANSWRDAHDAIPVYRLTSNNLVPRGKGGKISFHEFVLTHGSLNNLIQIWSPFDFTLRTETNLQLSNCTFKLMFSIIYPSFDVESVQFILNEKHTRISSTRLSCFGYVLWVCLSDYTGIMDRAFKGTLVCFSLSLKDTRAPRGWNERGACFCSIPLTCVSSFSLSFYVICHMLPHFSVH